MSAIVRKPMPQLGDQVRITLTGMVNAIGSHKHAPDLPEGFMVFVVRPEWGQDIHGWGHGYNVWVRLDEIEVVE